MSPQNIVDSDPYNFNSDQLPKMSSTPGNPRNHITPPIVTFSKDATNKEEHIVVEAVDNSGINLLQNLNLVEIGESGARKIEKNTRKNYQGKYRSAHQTPQQS